MDIKPGWLELTKQQFDILMIIYDLKINKIPIKAGNIISEYNNRFNKELQRQNFFNQLTALLDSGMVEKREKATYEINKDKIKQLLDNKKKEMTKELERLDDFSNSTEEKFRQIITAPSKPIVTYLDPNLYIETIASLLNKSKACYADSPFPNITYTDKLSKGVSREKFVFNQRNNCFVVKIYLQIIS